MKILLDTHAFLWSYSEPKRLSATAAEAMVNPANEIFVSAVTFWEIAIKVRLGKLKSVGKHPSEIIRIAGTLGFEPVPLLPEEAAASSELTENTHFDPFDRMLVWQAIQRKLILISSDKAFDRFRQDGLKLLWK